jgi:peptidoglycan/LPS O-acetylase OafA/YrhL
MYDGSPALPGTDGHGRSAGIDVLRGLCILFVVLLHIEIRIPIERSALGAALPRPLVSILVRSGYYGVVIFFVISGFLITSIALRRWQSLERLEIGPFYWLRAARILPTLLLLMLVASILHKLRVPGFIIPSDKASLGGVILAVLTFRVNTLEATGYFLPASWDALWSLSIEEMFYLLFPLACLLLRSERRFLLLLTAVAAIGPVARTFWHDHDDHTYLECMDGIALGCMAAIAAVRLPVSTGAARVTFLAGLAAATLVFGFRHETYMLGLTKNGLNNTLLEAGIGLMLIGMQRGVTAGASGTATAPLRLLGRNSYEIYLTHSFVTVAMVPLYRAAGTTRWIPLWYVAGVAGSALLGWAVNTMYSEPLNRMLRRALPSGRRLQVA